MLIALLILSVIFTVVTIVAEAIPPKPKPTKVVVEMREDNDWDEDRPTVVALPKNKPNSVARENEDYSAIKQSALKWWTNWSPHAENALGAASIMILMWLGWLWAYLMES